MRYPPPNRWHINWTIYKWNNAKDKELGKEPDEIIEPEGNLLLACGVSEFLKLLSGLGGTPYNAENTRICIGSNSTLEKFYQCGILASDENKATAKMDEGFPYIGDDGIGLYYQASFGENEANFVWNEVSVQNGEGVGSIALNRKTDYWGQKTGGVWTVRVRMSITDGYVYD